MRRRGNGVVLIDLESDGDDDASKSKCSRTSRRTTVTMHGNSKNALPSYVNVPQNRSSRTASSRRNKENLPKNKSSRIASSTRNKANQDKELWKRLDEDKKSAYVYFDSLWYNMYLRGHNKSNVLKWIKAKRIFSRQYVFVPMVCWGHWNLLVLCHFDETDCSDSKKGPRMIVLDSLNETDSKLQSDIRSFIRSIFKTEEREETRQFINKIRLEFPKSIKQLCRCLSKTGMTGGYMFFTSSNLAAVLENKRLEEDFGQLFEDGLFNPEELENFRKDIRSFQANRNSKTEELV